MTNPQDRTIEDDPRLKALLHANAVFLRGVAIATVGLRIEKIANLDRSLRPLFFVDSVESAAREELRSEDPPAPEGSSELLDLVLQQYRELFELIDSEVSLP